MKDGRRDLAGQELERITICEPVLAALSRAYPDLSRSEVLYAIVRAGPECRGVHEELRRLVAKKAAAPAGRPDHPDPIGPE